MEHATVGKKEGDGALSARAGVFSDQARSHLYVHATARLDQNSRRNDSQAKPALISLQVNARSYQQRLRAEIPELEPERHLLLTAA
jgi:hypothetical protein